MELITNKICFDLIFGVIKTLNLWPPSLCPSVGHKDGGSIHFLLKMSNTHSPITLKRNALALQDLAKMCSFELSTIQLTF